MLSFPYEIPTLSRRPPDSLSTGKPVDAENFPCGKIFSVVCKFSVHEIPMLSHRPPDSLSTAERLTLKISPAGKFSQMGLIFTPLRMTYGQKTGVSRRLTIPQEAGDR